MQQPILSGLLQQPIQSWLHKYRSTYPVLGRVDAATRSRAGCDRISRILPCAQSVPHNAQQWLIIAIRQKNNRDAWWHTSHQLASPCAPHNGSSATTTSAPPLSRLLSIGPPKLQADLPAQQPALRPNELTPKTQGSMLQPDTMAWMELGPSTQPTNRLATGTGTRLPAVQNKERMEGRAFKHSTTIAPCCGTSQSHPSNRPRLSDRSLCAKCLVTMLHNSTVRIHGQRSCMRGGQDVRAAAIASTGARHP